MADKRRAKTTPTTTGAQMYMSPKAKREYRRDPSGSPTAKAVDAAVDRSVVESARETRVTGRTPTTGAGKTSAQLGKMNARTTVDMSSRAHKNDGTARDGKTRGPRKGRGFKLGMRAKK